MNFSGFSRTICFPLAFLVVFEAFRRPLPRFGRRQIRPDRGSRNRGMEKRGDAMVGMRRRERLAACNGGIAGVTSSMKKPDVGDLWEINSLLCRTLMNESMSRAESGRVVVKAVGPRTSFFLPTRSDDQNQCSKQGS